MSTLGIIICIIGLLIDIWFIKTEYAGEMLNATIRKGLASLMFVALGIYYYTMNPSSLAMLIVIGLVLGMIGDIFLNMRNLYTGLATEQNPAFSHH